MYSTKINGHKYAAVKVNHYNDGSIALQSYSTLVIEIDAEGWMKVNGLYSMTTIKHIGWFMRELGFDYYTAKHAYEHKYELNLNTREVR